MVRVSSQEDLRSIALSEFAIAGYTATSLQRIAEIAGLSKSSVLYHFVSKEALLEVAITPAVDRMEGLIESLEGTELTIASQRAFIAGFVDFLLDHRNEVHLFINQGRSLDGLPIMERANAIVVRLATFFFVATTSTEDRMRFGVALGGAAYTLAAQGSFKPDVSPDVDPPDLEPPVEETRAALVTIVSELLAPIAVRPAAIRRVLI